jgi:putative flippase GtrA
MRAVRQGSQHCVPLVTASGFTAARAKGKRRVMTGGSDGTGLLTAERREVLGQLIRYALTGGFVTLLYAIVYSGVLRIALPLPPNLHAQSANLLGYLVAVVLGYFLHSAWSFRGHGSRDSHARTGGRFFIVSLVSLGLNAIWTWLFLAVFHWERHTPLLAICFVTPIIVFWLNRVWVFE